MELWNINNAIENLDLLNKKPVYVEGLLSFEFENISVNHFPRIEYRDLSHSSIWIGLDYNILRFDRRVMNKWHCKRVTVEGTLQKPDPYFGGTGHMCLWSASIIATDIMLFKN